MKEQLQFATPADLEAWQRDYFYFGTALLDQDGKHVPLGKYFAEPVITNDRPDPELDRTLSAVNDAINQPGE